MLACTNTVRTPNSSTAVELTAFDHWTSAIFDDCPMCGKEPLEPVRVDGQLAFQSCTSACTICGRACVSGDDACGECGRHLGLQRQAVLA